jgi:hypothetical protein
MYTLQILIKLRLLVGIEIKVIGGNPANRHIYIIVGDGNDAAAT